MSKPGGQPEVSKPSDVRGLLLTVGGTVEPIAHTLLEIRPKHAVLVCSEETQQTAVEAKRVLKQQLGPDQQPRFKTLLVDDPANLVACHQQVTAGLTYLREKCGLNREAIRIDFTGGTKAMSAAAVLAAAPDGYRFCYVSGTQRNKDGIGVVVTGTEKMHLPENPWTLLEEPEIRRLLEMAALGQWAAARDCARRLIRRSTAERSPLFQQLDRTLEGLSHWDRFEHEDAWKAWGEGRAPRELQNLATVGRLPLLVQFASKCQRMIGLLGPLAKAPKVHEKKADSVVLDMLSNGDRQAGRGLYDEAALRYYRAVELCVDRRLQHLHGIDNGNVNETDVPSPLREELLSRHGPPNPVWKLGQRDSIALLAAKGDAVGKRLLDHDKELDAKARNANWLIHGTEHVDEKRCLAYRRKILEALDTKEQAIPQWPDFRP